LTFDLADGVITGADLGHGDVEVQFEGEDSPCEENYKDHKCGILEICELNLEVETDDGYQVWFRSYFVWDLRHYFTLTSSGRNSTRHPMDEFGGGGLNLMLCQLVD